MFNRRGTTDDDLGMPENLNDIGGDATGLLRTHNMYWLKVTRDTEDLMSTVAKHMSRISYPLQVFQSTDFSF